MKHRFAVIICPKCKRAKIIEQDKQTTTCPYCNTTHKLKNIRMYYQTNDQEKARKIVGLIHAKQDNKQDEVAELL